MSSRDVRSSESALGPVRVLLCFFALLVGPTSSWADETVTLRQTFMGPLGFFATGQAMASDINKDGEVDVVDQPATVSVSASDVAAGATLVKAFLYWAGTMTQPKAGACTDSGDNQVDLTPPGGSATPITADVSYCSDTASGTVDMQAHRADVTAHVGSLTGDWTVDSFSALISNGSTHNASFSIVLIFSAQALPWQTIQLHDGLQTFASSSDTVTASGLAASSPASGELAFYVLDGDPGISTTEGVTVNGQPGGAGPLTLTDSSNPADNPMNHTINTQDPDRTDSVGVDIDAFDVSSALTAGDTSVDIEFTADTDTWWLVYSLLGVLQVPPPPDPALVVDGAIEATAYLGDGELLAGIATDDELAAHAADPNAHTMASPGTAGAAGSAGTAGRDARAAAQSLALIRYHADLFATALCEALDYRFIDRGEGTVLDCRTGLVWLKDAGCLGEGFWDVAGRSGSGQEAVQAFNGAETANRYLCDDYAPGAYDDWRLPSEAELCGLWDTDRGCALQGHPAARLPNARGDGDWSENRPFVGVRSGVYLTLEGLWGVDVLSGSMERNPGGDSGSIWLVRGLSLEKR